MRKKLYRTSEQKTAHTHGKAKLVLEWRYQPLVNMFRNHIKEQLDADSPYLFLTVGGEWFVQHWYYLNSLFKYFKLGNIPTSTEFRKHVAKILSKKRWHATINLSSTYVLQQRSIYIEFTHTYTHTAKHAVQAHDYISTILLPSQHSMSHTHPTSHTHSGGEEDVPPCNTPQHTTLPAQDIQQTPTPKRTTPKLRTCKLA